MTQLHDPSPGDPKPESEDEVPSTLGIKIGVTLFMILIVVAAVFGAVFLKSIVQPADPAEVPAAESADDSGAGR